MDPFAFQPTDGNTVSVSATSVTARHILGGQPSQPDGTRVQYRIYNAGPDTAFIRFGDSTVVATTSDIPIPSGVVEVMTLIVPHGAVGGAYVAAITASGTATVYFTTGVGI